MVSIGNLNCVWKRPGSPDEAEKMFTRLPAVALGQNNHQKSYLYFVPLQAAEETVFIKRPIRHCFGLTGCKMTESTQLKLYVRRKRTTAAWLTPCCCCYNRDRFYFRLQFQTSNAAGLEFHRELRTGVIFSNGYVHG